MQYPTTTVSGIHSTAVHSLMLVELVTLFHTQCIIALELLMQPFCYPSFGTAKCDYDYDYIMAPQRGRPYGANLGSMGRNTGTWSIRSECLSNITSWSRRKGIENTTLPFIPE